MQRPELGAKVTISGGAWTQEGEVIGFAPFCVKVRYLHEPEGIMREDFFGLDTEIRRGDPVEKLKIALKDTSSGT
jgi:hypothetical protein